MFPALGNWWPRCAPRIAGTGDCLFFTARVRWPPAHTTTDTIRAAGGRGLMVMTAGAREALRFLPPLTISEAEVEEALAAFGGALEDVFGGK